MKIRYIGNFPPPYGGVTIKNQLLYDELSGHMKISCFKHKETCPQKISQIINCLLSLFPNQKLIIGISSKGGKSLLQTKLLYYLNLSNMRRSIYFMMGGREAERIAKDKKQVQMYKQYKQIYVETQGMKSELENVGLNNIHIYPNCRFKPNTNVDIKYDISDNLRCAFFSRITPDKGIDIVINVAKSLSNTEFHLYGEIDSTYSDTFSNKINNLTNVTYHGIFKGKDTEVYDELSKYDVILLPTRWKNEGVPGVLVEAKIAGTPAIVSDICYNAEIVENGVSGIVLKENTVENLIEAIECLDKNREELYRLKVGAKQSAEKYYIENYIDDILKKLEE